MNTFPVTPQFFEVTDGMLIVWLGIMLLFALMHLGAIWLECRRVLVGTIGFWQCLRGVYYERKPSVAHIVITFGLFVRFTTLWHLRHITNHQLPPDLIARHGFEIFVFSYITIILGVICWVRNISPFRVRNWEWVAILIASVMLSLWWAGVR